MFDGKAFGAEIVGIVKDYVAREVEPLRRENADLVARLAALEARPIAKDGAAGRDGVDGANGAGVDSAMISDAGVLILRLTSGVEIEAGTVRGADGENGAEGPAGKDGADGLPGAPGQPGENGKDGAPGQDGDRGEDGRDGKDADPVAIEAMIAERVEKAVSALPKAKDGRDGVDGKDGSDGRDGVDGVGLAGALIDRDGGLVVTLTNGEAKSLGPVVGRDGKDGEAGRDGSNGRDGFSLNHFDAEVMEDGRTLLLKFADETDVGFAVELAIPTMIYRGVFKDGQSYERGDMVTWGGSLWHCDDVTADKPGEGAKAWTLAAKRGRDGKDGKDGLPGERGKEGPRGRDLTQMGPDGSKW